MATESSYLRSSTRTPGYEAMATGARAEWFETSEIRENLHLTREIHFFEGNRANIWLVNGPNKDVIIDTGLGVRNLRSHLESAGYIKPAGERECIVVCTHNHFDHSGGARHFETVYIHEEDLDGLRAGRQTETLNYVKQEHFYREPSHGFSACNYKVPPTACQPLKDGDQIDLGGGEHLDIVHVPGHTKGSIAIHYPAKRELFTGDFVYDCGWGGGLIDWLPTSSIRKYVDTSYRMMDWMADKDIARVYPGHFDILSKEQTHLLLQEYVESKDNACSMCCGSCLQATTWAYFLCGCFRCCPC